MENYKNLLQLTTLFIIALFMSVGFTFPVFASSIDGTINSTNEYAWSENAGWINFGTAQGNVHVNDAGLSGYAWGENIGWISLNCSNDNSCATVNYGVANDSEGNLSGYAWSENAGWINFAPTYGGVTIDSNGNFAGYAWGENTGWIVFNCSTTNSCATVTYGVSSDWQLASQRYAYTPDKTSPGKVTNFTAQDVASDGQIKLSWTDSSDSDFVQTYLYRGQTSDFICDSSTLIAKISGAPSAVSLYTDTGLTNNQIYYYTARTIDGSGNLETGLHVLYPTVSATPTKDTTTPTIPTPTPATPPNPPPATGIVPSSPPTTPAQQIAILDGDLIKTADSPDVYIVKIVGSKMFRRHILNPAIFNSYGQLKWSNIKTVTQDVMNMYTVSNLVLAIYPDGTPVSGRVYQLISTPGKYDTGIKQWLNITPAQFVADGYDWDSVYKINTIEAGSKFYPTGVAITG